MVSFVLNRDCVDGKPRESLTDFDLFHSHVDIDLAVECLLQKFLQIQTGIRVEVSKDDLISGIVTRILEL